MKTNFTRADVLTHILLWVGVVFSAFPFFWMILVSVRSSSDAFNLESMFWPQQWDLINNYSEALFTTPVLGFMLNGVIVCACILFMQILTAVPCAYAIAKLRFQGKTLLITTIIICMAIPFHSVALPLFVGFAKLRLLNSYIALTAPFFVSVLAILMLAQYIRGFPDEVIEAARLDGMSEGAILTRLIIPASKPPIAAFAIFSVSSHWNDLYWPLIVVTSPDLAPPTLGIMFFHNETTGDNIGPLMAMATLITLPLVIFFLSAQRRFVQGITMASMK